MSLESLEKQDIHWDTFILYNAGDYPTEEILKLVPNKFNEIDVFPVGVGSPKSATYDWDVQFRSIGGHDRYFVHKADFYLPRGVCSRFEQLEGDDAWIVPFSKFDMKEKAIPCVIEQFAEWSWDQAVESPMVGSYDRHHGKLAIPFRQGPDGIDGTMHGYSEAMRSVWKGGDNHEPWGLAQQIVKACRDGRAIFDPDFFALHIWHHVPEKNDMTKLEAGERF